jgi:protoheme IX farnesyltransferase
MASRGPLDWPHLLRALGGTALIAGGAMALNQLLEVESDAKMKRTENRPLPSGRISPRAVLFVGIFLSASGLLVLTAGVNLLTGCLAALTLGTYLFVYTPLKTKTSLCTLAGAIPGAAPPLLGWAAAGGELNSSAWVLFGILFVWQLPHVLAVSWVYREDYGRAGFQMLAVKDPKGETVSALIVFYSSLLLFLSLLPSLTRITGPNYFLSSLLLGTWFLGLAFLTSLDLEHRAKSFFKASIFYLALLFLFLILDKKIL